MTHTARPGHGRRVGGRHRMFYWMLLPGLVYTLVFKLLPMYGVVLAFKEYNIFKAATPFLSVFESPFVGLKYFRMLYTRPDFLSAFRNTLLISLYKILFVFPIPILFALLLNELRGKRFKATVQQIVYLPHFLSWTVAAGLFVSILSNNGVLNSLLAALGLDRVAFLMDRRVFRSVLVSTDAWKTFGWGSIVYLAAISGLDQEVYEAATVDGANRFRRIWHITLPGIASTIVLMLILRVGSLLDAGFEQIFVLYNPVVYDVADIINTYVYRIGLGEFNFSLGTAVGLFNSTVSIVMVLSANTLARRLTGRSIW